AAGSSDRPAPTTNVVVRPLPVAKRSSSARRTRGRAGQDDRVGSTAMRAAEPLSQPWIADVRQALDCLAATTTKPDGAAIVNRESRGQCGSPSPAVVAHGT